MTIEGVQVSLRTNQVGRSDGRAPTRLAALIALIGALIMSSGLILLTSSSASATQEVSHKSYVCKYVNKPGGGTELLQTGQNPIWVDNHSIAGKDVVSVGDKFSDAQGYSQVIV